MLYVKNLKKIYPNGKGIFDINFQVNKGEILALIGPNGSGKSTTIKLIAGINKADAGISRYNKVDTNKSKSIIGYLPETPFLYNFLSPVEFLLFIASMKGIKTSLDEIDHWLNVFDLYKMKNANIESFSMGMKRKVSIVSTLIGEPELIILDEPTNGIDTKSIIMLKKIIFEKRNSGCTIILSSHVLDFVEKIVDSVVFIKDGYVEHFQYNNLNVDLESIYSDIYL